MKNLLAFATIIFSEYHVDSSSLGATPQLDYVPTRAHWRIPTYASAPLVLWPTLGRLSRRRVPTIHILDNEINIIATPWHSCIVQSISQQSDIALILHNLVRTTCKAKISRESHKSRKKTTYHANAPYGHQVLCIESFHNHRSRHPQCRPPH
jgi:hypothetical protein